MKKTKITILKPMSNQVINIGCTKDEPLDKTPVVHIKGAPPPSIKIEK